MTRLSAWLTPKRAVLVLTILLALISSLYEVVADGEDTNAGEGTNAIVTLLIGFLAFDLLIERINLLERIDQKVDIIRSSTSRLIRHSNLELLEEIDKRIAIKEVWTMAATAGHLLTENISFLEKKAQKVRLLLYDTEKSDNMASSTDRGTVISDEEKWLRPLYSKLYEADCEIKILKANLGFSLLLINPNHKVGSAYLTVYGYQTNPAERLTIIISKVEEEDWFNFLVKQFNLAWDGNEAHVWKQLPNFKSSS
jgi:hypothetical protein